MNVKVVERSQQIKVQAQEIIRKEKELEANIRKPAEAQKYKEEKNAEANKNKIILEAEAEAEAIRVSHKFLSKIQLPYVYIFPDTCRNLMMEITTLTCFFLRL